MHKELLGFNKRKRLAGILTNFTQIIFGAGIVSYFFKEGSLHFRFAAFLLFVSCFVIAMAAEPDEGEN